METLKNAVLTACLCAILTSAVQLLSAEKNEKGDGVGVRADVGCMHVREPFRRGYGYFVGRFAVCR